MDLQATVLKRINLRRKLFCRFRTFLQGFIECFLEKIAILVSKNVWGGGAVWNISENSSLWHRYLSLKVITCLDLTLLIRPVQSLVCQSSLNRSRQISLPVVADKNLAASSQIQKQREGTVPHWHIPFRRHGGILENRESRSKLRGEYQQTWSQTQRREKTGAGEFLRQLL